MRDGSILISGAFSNQSGQNFSVVRLFADGTLDPTFQVRADLGSIAIDAIQKDGAFLCGGSFTTVDGVSRHSIARLLPIFFPAKAR